MRTITEKYNAVLEGKFSKAQFKTDVIRELPNLVSKFNDFETIGSILKSKGIIAEKKDKAVEKYQPEYKDPADKFPIEAIERGIDYELEKAGIDSAETHSEEDHKKAKDKALKNLEKDPNFYLHLLSGDSKKVDKNDKHVEVKRGEEAVDSLNGMKKAEMNEEFKKEYVADADEIRQFLEKKLSSKHDEHIVDAVYKELFDGIEFLVDDQPGTGELEAAYSISENLEEQYDEEGKSEHLAIAQEITKLLEPYFMALENKKKELPKSIADKEKRDIEKDAKKSKGMIKEDLQQICNYLKEKFGANWGECKDFIMTHFDDITVGGHIDLEEIGEEYENYVAANLPETKEENLHETAKNKITKIISEILNERVGALDDFISLIQDRSAETGFSEKEEAEEVCDAIKDHYGLNEGKKMKQLKEVRQEVLDRIDGLTHLGLLKDLIEKAKEIYQNQIDNDDLFDSADVAYYLYGQIFDALKELEPAELQEQNFSFSGMLISEGKKPASKMSQVEAAGRRAAIEAKLTTIEELISSTNESLATLEENEDIARIVDKNEVKALRKEVKLLEKMKDKLTKEQSKYAEEKEVVTNEAKEGKQYIKVSEGHCNEIMEKLKERYASEGIKFTKEGKDIINAGHCTEGKMKEIIAELKKEGYKVHESSCNSH